MTSAFPNFLVLSFLLCTVQLLVALPWVFAVDPELVKSRFRNASAVGTTLAVFVAICFGFAYVLNLNSDPDALAAVGKVYAFILQVQLSALFFAGAFFVMLKFFPKAGAVALAAFREGVRQPLFWIMLLAGVGLLLVSPFIPYFTFGEDDKMLKDLGYMTIMFTGAVFAVLAAAMSISEEIEGRAAITVMSKPISRRNFLMGKFLGILLAAFLMNVLLSWLMVWMTTFYAWWNPPVAGQVEPDPAWIGQWTNTLFAEGGLYAYFARGYFLWVDAMGTAFPGFIITFGQVMVLLAIAVAFATRVPMIVNVMLCLVVYFLGHLTPVLTAVSQYQLRLVSFLAQVFNYILPGLDMFDMGPAVVRYAPLPPQEFGIYTFHVTLYAIVYAIIAILFGLILFEDRDLA